MEQWHNLKWVLSLSHHRHHKNNSYKVRLFIEDLFTHIELAVMCLWRCFAHWYYSKQSGPFSFISLNLSRFANQNETTNRYANHDCIKSYILAVTLPDGVYGGQTIHVQAPNGKLNEIIVPDGFGPGSTFTVEFADDAAMQHDKFKGQQQQYASTTKQSYATPATTSDSNNYPTADTNRVPNSRADYDDGFASGFQNPNFVPGPVSSSTAPTYASASISNNNSYNNNAYPMATADAKPVY